MEINIQKLWFESVHFVQEYKLFSSFVFVVLFLTFRQLVVRVIKKRSKRKGEDRRHQINLIEQLTNAFLIICLLMFWSAEVQNLAISIAAFMVAIVFATREFIQCFMGFIYYMSARPFRVGDWVQMNNVVGEVVEMDWAKTTLLEVETESFAYTGKHVYMPNSQLVTQSIKNLNFLRRYTMHEFTITMEPLVNGYKLLPEFSEKAKAHCEYYRDVAERYKSVIERHLDAEFIAIDPVIVIETNKFAKLLVKVSLFCPTVEASDLEQKICNDWMDLWYKELDAQKLSPAPPAVH